MERAPEPNARDDRPELGARGLTPTVNQPQVEDVGSGPRHDRLGIDRRCYRVRGSVDWSHEGPVVTARVEVLGGRRYVVHWLSREVSGVGTFRRQRIHRVYICPTGREEAEVIVPIEADVVDEIRRLTLGSVLPRGLRWGDGWATIEIETDPPPWAGPRVEER